VPPRSVLPARPRHITSIAAVAVLLAGVLIPTSGAGASGCNLLIGLLAVCTSTSTATPSATTGPTCAGPTLLKANGTLWRCTFDAEFGGTRLNRKKWSVQRTSAWGFHSGAECMVDTPQNLSVSHGHLNLTVRDVAQPFTCLSPTGSFTTHYTGATVFSRSFGQQFGRFEIRAKFPQSDGIPGLQSSLWLYPRQMSAGTVVSGPTEIDIAEAYSRNANVVVPVVHGLSVSPYLPTSYCTVTNWGAAYHTYAVEWTPSRIDFIIDGHSCMQVTAPPAAPALAPVQPFLVALTQALGVRGNVNTTASPLPGTTKIDYVRVWQ
jgi:beta-glucanase (GH16 family)